MEFSELLGKRRPKIVKLYVSSALEAVHVVGGASGKWIGLDEKWFRLFDFGAWNFLCGRVSAGVESGKIDADQEERIRGELSRLRGVATSFGQFSDDDPVDPVRDEFSKWSDGFPAWVDANYKAWD